MENNYLALLLKIWHLGKKRQTRVGLTRALFGETLHFDLTQGFPATTVKKLQFKSVAGELAGFLRAETDARKMGSKIWLPDAKRWHQESEYSKHEADMGKVYGYWWRRWGHIDQLQSIVDTLNTNPTDRRLVVSCWNPDQMHLGCLPPCHYAYQFYVDDGKYLCCMFHMRSVDCVLGLPFDIASYALLTHIVAQEVGLMPKKLIATLGDTHVYENHGAALQIMTSRQPFNPPALKLDPFATINNFVPEMAKLLNYQHWGIVEAKLNA